MIDEYNAGSRLIKLVKLNSQYIKFKYKESRHSCIKTCRTACAKLCPKEWGRRWNMQHLHGTWNVHQIELILQSRKIKKWTCIKCFFIESAQYFNIKRLVIESAFFDSCSVTGLICCILWQFAVYSSTAYSLNLKESWRKTNRLLNTFCDMRRRLRILIECFRGELSGSVFKPLEVEG